MRLRVAWVSFAAVASAFCLLALLYALLTGASQSLLPSPIGLRAERILWWVVFCIVSWTLGASAWQLLAHALTAKSSVFVGTSLGFALIGAGCWYAHYVDPGNEDKVLRADGPRILALVAAGLAASMVVVVSRTGRPYSATDLRQSATVLDYARYSAHASGGSYLGWVGVAAGAIALGAVCLLLKKQTHWLDRFVISSQLLQLLFLFVIPAAALECAYRAASWSNTRSGRFAARAATPLLMAIAAFLF